MRVGACQSDAVTDARGSGGMLPEVTTANEFTGDHPKRFSASVLATSREKVCVAFLAVPSVAYARFFRAPSPHPLTLSRFPPITYPIYFPSIPSLLRPLAIRVLSASHGFRPCPFLDQYTSPSGKRYGSAARRTSPTSGRPTVTTLSSSRRATPSAGASGISTAPSTRRETLWHKTVL